MTGISRATRRSEERPSFVRALAGLVVKWRAEAKRHQIAAAELSRDEGVEAFQRLMHEIEERRLLQCASDLLTLLDPRASEPGVGPVP
jgi:hypothetical protein